MFIGTVISRFPNGEILASVVYAGPSMENAKKVTKAFAGGCTVETVWQIQDIGDNWQFIATFPTEARTIGYLPPPPESKEIEENKD